MVRRTGHATPRSNASTSSHAAAAKRMRLANAAKPTPYELGHDHDDEEQTPEIHRRRLASPDSDAASGFVHSQDSAILHDSAHSPAKTGSARRRRSSPNRRPLSSPSVASSASGFRPDDSVLLANSTSHRRAAPVPTKQPRRLPLQPPRMGQRQPQGVKRLRKFRPGTRALMEIRKYQKSSDLLIPKLPFSRLVRELGAELGRREYRWTQTAVRALQEAAEAYLVSLFESAQTAAYHARRVTVMPRDIHLVRKLRGNKYAL